MPDANQMTLHARESSPFYRALTWALQLRGMAIDDICPADDPIARRVLHDYGAMFVASDDVMPPPVCVFTSEDEVTAFQETAGYRPVTIGDAVIELQPTATEALLQGRAAAQAEGLDI